MCVCVCVCVCVCMHACARILCMCLRLDTVRGHMYLCVYLHSFKCAYKNVDVCVHVSV